MNQILLSLALSLGFTNLSFAGPAAFYIEGPCKKDAETLCAGIKPGAAFLMKCFKENKTKLSPDCLAQQDKMQAALEGKMGACDKDIKKLCGGLTPAKGRLAKCIQDKAPQFSAACKAEVSGKKPAAK